MTRRQIKKLIMAMPGGTALLRLQARYLAHRRVTRRGDPEALFQQIYESGGWGKGKSVSGQGSSLELPPFSLGKPIRRIDDWIEGFPVRHLTLWRREGVEEALTSNRAFRRAIRSSRRPDE